MNRDLTLKPRKEGVRDKQKGTQIIEYDLTMIKQHFDESLSIIKEQFEIADSMIKSGDNDKAEYIWRAQIVFLESILDFYIHELSKYAMIAMYSNKWEKSDKYKNFMIPMKSLEECIENQESNMWLLETVNIKFSREVYLGYESMKDQVNLIGLNFMDILQTTFESAEAGKMIIRKLFDRRNQISHQLDRKHTTAEQENITREFVLENIQNIEKLVSNIHNAAIENERS